METIQFRGKRTDNGEWVYGNLFYWIKRGVKIPVIGEGVQNGSVMGHEVDPVSVGQYIGLKDKWNRLIFFGDECNDRYGRTLKVVYHNYRYQWYCAEEDRWRYADFVDWVERKDGELTDVANVTIISVP